MCILIHFNRLEYLQVLLIIILGAHFRLEFME